MDRVSLTLTIGPVVLKAATLVKQCHDIQANLSLPLGRLDATALECTEIHQLLESFQAVGRRDLTKLEAGKAREFGYVVGNVTKRFSKVLTSIEQHVEILEEFSKKSPDGDIQVVSETEGFQWKEDEVRKILQESKQYRDIFTSLLMNLQIPIEPQTPVVPKEEAQNPEVPIIPVPIVTPPIEESQPNKSRFSIDSVTTHDFAINPSRFSADSLSSILSATHFDFDLEALSSPSYRQAFGDRVRSIISRPLNSPGDSNFLRAVEPLEGEDHYYEQSIELEWDPSISGSTILSDGSESDRSSLRTLESQVSLTGASRQRIGHPVNPVHVTHVGLDPETGEFVGLPAEWRRILFAEDERARAAAAATSSAGTSSTSGDGSAKKIPTIKLVVVGDPGKLKQYLLATYVTNKYPEEYVLPVYDNYAVTVMIGDEPYTLGLFDTTGQEGYDRLRPLSYPQTDVFLILISTSKPSHYKSARDTWAPELKHHCPGVPFLLVGIQDPPNDALDTASRKKARLDEGTKLAREIGAEKYVECELTSQRGVKNVFDEAIVAALEPPAVPKKRRRSRLRLLSRIEED